MKKSDYFTYQQQTAGYINSLALGMGNLKLKDGTKEPYVDENGYYVVEGASLYSQQVQAASEIASLVTATGVVLNEDGSLKRDANNNLVFTGDVTNSVYSQLQLKVDSASLISTINTSSGTISQGRVEVKPGNVLIQAINDYKGGEVTIEAARINLEGYVVAGDATIGGADFKQFTRNDGTSVSNITVTNLFVDNGIRVNKGPLTLNGQLYRTFQEGQNGTSYEYLYNHTHSINYTEGTGSDAGKITLTMGKPMVGSRYIAPDTATSYVTFNIADTAFYKAAAVSGVTVSNSSAHPVTFGESTSGGKTYYNVTGTPQFTFLDSSKAYSDELDYYGTTKTMSIDISSKVNEVIQAAVATVDVKSIVDAKATGDGYNANVHKTRMTIKATAEASYGGYTGSDDYQVSFWTDGSEYEAGKTDANTAVTLSGAWNAVTGDLASNRMLTVSNSANDTTYSKSIRLGQDSSWSSNKKYVYVVDGTTNIARIQVDASSLVSDAAASVNLESLTLPNDTTTGHGYSYSKANSTLSVYPQYQLTGKSATWWSSIAIPVAFETTYDSSTNVYHGDTYDENGYNTGGGNHTTDLTIGRKVTSGGTTLATLDDLTINLSGANAFYDGCSYSADRVYGQSHTLSATYNATTHQYDMTSTRVVRASYFRTNSAGKTYRDYSHTATASTNTTAYDEGQKSVSLAALSVPNETSSGHPITYNATNKTISFYPQYRLSSKTASSWWSQITISDTGLYNAGVNSVKLQTKTITANGTVTPDSGYSGFSSVTVNVSGSGSPSITLSEAKGAYKSNPGGTQCFTNYIVYKEGYYQFKITAGSSTKYYYFYAPTGVTSGNYVG